MKTIHRSTASFALCSLLAMAAAAPVVALEQDDPMNDPMNDQKSDQPVSDTWITTKVKSELATTDGVKSMDISVKTVNGVVTLTGTQPNPMAIQNAVATAEKIKGVKRVDATNLTVRNDTTKDRPHE